MHFSRKLILLTAFMVGLGFVGSGEVHAAALVKSVQITSPDSGALLGIDKHVPGSRLGRGLFGAIRPQGRNIFLAQERADP